MLARSRDFPAPDSAGATRIGFFGCAAQCISHQPHHHCMGGTLLISILIWAVCGASRALNSPVCAGAESQHAVCAPSPPAIFDHAGADGHRAGSAPAGQPGAAGGLPLLWLGGGSASLLHCRASLIAGAEDGADDASLHIGAEQQDAPVLPGMKREADDGSDDDDAFARPPPSAWLNRAVAPSGPASRTTRRRSASTASRRTTMPPTTSWPTTTAPT